MHSLFSRISIAFILLFIANTISAQSQSNQLIAYKDFFFLNSSTTFSYEDYEPSFLNEYGYAIAYQQAKGDRKYRQYELKYAGVNTLNLETALQRVEVQMNYRRGKYWKKPISEGIRPRHSIAGRLFYIYEDIDPLFTSDFPIYNRAYGLGLDYLIGLDIKLGPSLNLLIDCSLMSMNFGYNKSILKNPTLTLRQQAQGGFDFNLGSQRVLKIGVAVNL